MTDLVSSSREAWQNGAIRLAQVLRWNRYDARYQEAGNVIVPVMDANVVHLFINPAEEVAHVDAFPAPRVFGEPSPPPSAALTAFAAAAAEFLFLSTPALIGGERKQLWRQPVRIAPAHADELMGTINRLARESQRWAQKSTDREALEAQRLPDLRRFLNELPQFGKLSRTAQLASISRMTELMAGLFGPWLKLWRFNSLASEDAGLLPLLGHELCSADIVSPPDARIQQLYESLLPGKERSARLADPRDSGWRVRAARDARVLAQVMMLNERALDVERGKLRFALITTDDVLIEAYEALFWTGSLPGGTDIRSHVLRRPLQFTPVLNLSDIPNGLDDRDIFQNLVAAIEKAVEFLPAVKDRTDYALEYKWREQRSSEKTQASTKASMQHDAGEPALEALRQAWERAGETANVICAGLTLRRFERLFDLMSRVNFGPSGDDRGAVTKLQERLLAEFVTTPLLFDLQSLLEAAARDAVRQVEYADIGARRLSICLRSDVFADISDKPLSEFIADLAISASDPRAAESRIRKLAQLLEGKTPWRIFFFVGTIAAATNDFYRAERYLDRAQILVEDARQRELFGLRGVDGVDDLHYLRNVIRRLRMRSLDDYEDMLRRHKRIADTKSFSLEAVRASSEGAALALTAYLHFVLAIDNISPGSKSPQEYLTSADELLKQGLLILPRLTRGDDREAIEAVELQIRTNFLCHAVLTTHILESTPAAGHEPAVAAGARTHIDWLAQRQDASSISSDHIVALWCRSAEWLLAAQGHSRRGRAKVLAAFCQDCLIALRRDSSEHQATHDRPVFEIFAKLARLSADSETPPPS